MARIPLGSSITLRLDPATLSQYEAIAAALNISLSAYLRDRLEKGDAVAHELLTLRQTIAEAVAAMARKPPEAAQQDGKNGDLSMVGVQVETLLLLRTLMTQNNAQKVGMVQHELQRVGLPVWRSA